MRQSLIRAAIVTGILAAAASAAKPIELKDAPSGRFDAAAFEVVAIPETRGVAILFPAASELRLYPKLFDGSADGAKVARLPGFATRLIACSDAGKQRFLVFVPASDKVLEFDADLKSIGEIALGDVAGAARLAVRPGERPMLLVHDDGKPSELKAFDLRTRRALSPIPLVATGEQPREIPDSIVADPAGKLLYATRPQASPGGHVAYRFEPAATGGGEVLREVARHRESGRFIVDRSGLLVGAGQFLYDANLERPFSKTPRYYGDLKALLDGRSLGIVSKGTEFSFVDTNASPLEPLVTLQAPRPKVDDSLKSGEDELTAETAFAGDGSSTSATRTVLVTSADAWMLVDLAKLDLPAGPSLRIAVDGPGEATAGARGTWRVRSAPGVAVSLPEKPAGATLAADGTLAWTPGTPGVTTLNFEARPTAAAAKGGTPVRHSRTLFVSAPAARLAFDPLTVVAGGADFASVVAARLPFGAARGDPSSLATIDRKSHAVVAQRTFEGLGYRVPIATDGRHVFVALDKKDAIDVLDFRTLEPVRQILTPSRISGLEVRGGALLVSASRDDPRDASAGDVIAQVDLATLALQGVAGDDAQALGFERTVRRDAGGKIVELLDVRDAATLPGFANEEADSMRMPFDAGTKGDVRTLLRRGGQVVAEFGESSVTGSSDRRQSTAFAPGGAPLIARLDFTSAPIPAAGDVEAPPPAAAAAPAPNARQERVARARPQRRGQEGPRSRLWSLRLWDYEGAERTAIPLFAEPEPFKRDLTKPLLAACGSDWLAVVTGPRVQFVSADALRRSAGAVPTPLHFARGPEPVVVPRQGPAKLALAVTGGTPPYRFDSYLDAPYLAIDAKTGSVTLDVEAAVAALNAPQARQFGRPLDKQLSAAFFRFVAGAEARGVPAAVPIPVRVTDAGGRTVARFFHVLLDAPAAKP